MINNLVDLNNYLFEMLERLNDDSLKNEEFEKEIKKSKEVAKISQTIINNAELLFQTKKYFDNNNNDEEIPSLLRLGK